MRSRIKMYWVFLFVISYTAVGLGHPGPNVNSTTSTLLGVSFPNSPSRLPNDQVPPEFVNLFDKAITAAGPKIRRGEIEVFVWTDVRKGRVGAQQIMSQAERSLRVAGWEYQVADKTDELTHFLTVRTTPRKRGIIGFWHVSDDGLTLAITEMVRDDGTGGGQTGVSQRADSGSVKEFILSASDQQVNVMGNSMPQMPAFPSVPKRAGKIRGYVKDFQGNPIAGAYIGLRSSALGGFYSAAFGSTDAKGFYEIALPMGAVHFYAAGYTIDYGTGRAAVSLHPVDGEADAFASSTGSVENFVVLQYGIGDRNAVSERPWYAKNYYGGSVRINYTLGRPGDMWATTGSLPEGSAIEILLVQQSGQLGSVSNASFSIRRPTNGTNSFHINNLPVGRYRITARLANGKRLKMRKTGYDAMPHFGLQPSEAIGDAEVLLLPASPEARTGAPGRGNWNPADIKLELP